MSMTTDDLFRQELQVYVMREKARFSDYNDSPEPSRTDLGLLVSQLKIWKQKLSEVERINPGEFIPNVQLSIAKSYSDQIKIFEEGKVGIHRDFAQKRVDVKSTLSAKVSSAEQALQEYFSAKIKELQPLLQAQGKLKDSRSDIESVFRVYGIPIQNLNLDLRKYSAQEIEDLIKQGSYALKGILGARSVFQRGASILYLPAVVPEDDPNRNIFRASYSIAFLMLAYFFKPYFFAVFGLFYIFNSISNLSRIRERQELLQVIYSLSDQVDVNRLIKGTPEYQSLSQRLEHLKSLDCDTEIEALAKEESNAISEYEKSDPRRKMNKELDAWSAYVLSNEYEDAVTNAKYLISVCKQECYDRYWYALSEGEKLLESVRNEEGFLGDKISRHYTLSNSMRLGLLSYGNRNVCEALIELPYRGIYFDSSDQSVDKALLLLSNYLCNVRESYLEVKIIDPLYIGRDFADFRTPETDSIFTCVTKESVKFFNSILDDAIARSRKLGRGTIEEFNREAEAVGKMPLKYQLLIIRSDYSSMLQQPQFVHFLEYCHNIGYLVWIFEPSPQELGEEDAKRLAPLKSAALALMSRCTNGSLFTQENISLDSLSPEITPYSYDSLIGRKVSDTLSTAIKEGKVDAIDYETGYRQKVIPDDKIWSYSTRNGIELKLGYVDGDPSKPQSITLCDAPVHALLQGISGSGKSVTFNFIIANLLHMYAPSELKLFMMDFKRVEFAIYTGEYAIPHAELIAGTKDPTYAVSIFKYALEEMVRRQREAGTYGLKNIVEFNDYMTQRGLKKNKWPRILIIIDEFQEMFNMEPRAVNTITTMISQLAKLARAFGCHMLFGSQSMVGTVSRDVLDQFQLRISHYVPSDISFQFLGTKDACTMPPRGWCMTTTKGGEPNSVPTTWRIPFIPTSEIKRYITKLRALCSERGEENRNPKFYDEEEFFDNQMLFDGLNMEEVKKEDFPHTFLAGERTVVSSKKTPNNFFFSRDDFENLLIASANTEDLYRLAFTVLDNFKYRPGVEFLAYSCDRDMISTLHLKDYLAESALPWLEEGVQMSDVISVLEEIIEDRRKNGYSCPLYFALFGFDRSRGICEATSYDTQRRFQNILESAGRTDMHLIIQMRDPDRLDSPLRNCIKHFLCGYLTVQGSVAVSKTPDLNSMHEHYCTYISGPDTWKCKIYKYKVEGVRAKEV